MRFYSNVIFPRLMDRSMAGSDLARYRQVALAQVQGHVLEIGFGTGLNLPYYPPEVTQITALDPNPGMRSLAQPRIQSASIPIEWVSSGAESIPCPDQHFDSIVSTWTLCSVPDVDRALQEIWRLLKPEGRFHFVEHGLSPDRGIQTWQRWINPVQKVLGDGCQLIRAFPELIEAQGLRLQWIETHYAESLPKVFGYFYQGVAVVPQQKT